MVANSRSRKAKVAGTERNSDAMEVLGGWDFSLYSELGEGCCGVLNGGLSFEEVPPNVFALLRAVLRDCVLD